MKDIDHYLEQACRQISGSDSLRQHLRKELKEHLKEAIDTLVAEGMSLDNATAKAIEDLGDPELIRDGMQSVYGPGITSLFVEEAIKWKDRRWHIAAQIGLALNILLAILFVSFILLRVVPVAQELSEAGNVEPKGLMLATIQACDFAIRYWFVWLSAFAVAVSVFEGMCKSKNKLSIRTSILVGMSLVSTFGAFWVVGLTAIALAILVPGA